MINYPFHKLVIYLWLTLKCEREKFAKSIQSYLSSVAINPDELFQYAQKHLSKQPLPSGIFADKIDQQNFHIALKQQRILDLHMSFNDADFLDLIYDSDIRRKIDSMAISPLFRREEIYREFPNILPVLIDTYIDCFSNFDLLVSKTSYVNRYIGDEEEKLLLTKVLDNTSKKYLRLIIGLKAPEISPIDLISRALNIVTSKVETALLKGEDDKLDKSIKTQVMISEKLHKLGAGNKSDLDLLIETLNKIKPDYEDPHIYTKEELNAEATKQKENT